MIVISSKRQKNHLFTQVLLSTQRRLLDERQDKFLLLPSGLKRFHLYKVFVSPRDSLAEPKLYKSKQRNKKQCSPPWRKKLCLGGKSEAALNKEKGHFYGINAILCCWCIIIICGKE